MARRIMALTAVFHLTTACGSDAGAPAPAALPAPLAMLGPLAVAGQTRSVTIDPAGGAVPLDDGSRLALSPGALTVEADVSLQRVDLHLEALSMEVDAAWAYVIDASSEVPSFGAPVWLEIPAPSAEVAVLQWDSGRWVSRPVGTGLVARVDLAHFSPEIVAVARRAREIPAEHRIRAEITRTRGNRNTLAFNGVGETQPRTKRELCDELSAMLSGYPNRDYRYPSGSSFRNVELGFYLHSNGTPSVTGGYYWEQTKTAMPLIHQRLMATTAPVTPAGMLRICLDTYQGNVPMAVLACANYVKDATMRGRYAPFNEIPQDAADTAARLQPWRMGDTAPGGYYDKMGPLYHIFAAMTAGVWMTSSLGGEVAAVGEGFLRQFGTQGDPVDADKGMADRCGADVAHGLWFSGAGQAFGLGQGQPAPPVPLATDGGASTGDAGLPVVVDGGGLADAGRADGGTPDGGLPDGGDPAARFDAGPDPATNPQSWDGRWRGRIKGTQTQSAAMEPIVGEAVVEVTVVLSGGTVQFAGQLGSIVLGLTPSNPNAAFGRGPVDVAPGGGVTVNGRHATTAFLNGGRLYLARREDLVSRTVIPNIPVVDVIITKEMIGIFDRVP
ncbi:MAG: hypothetical protein HYY06_03550 [Deltaproteobacteria bacterium]|nr:hypothetical protein [Deltaproteobacteria bacterium]